MRQSPDGICIYSDQGKKEVAVPCSQPGRQAELEELYRAVVEDRPVFHDGKWGTATLEAVLGIMESARERKEIYLSRQVPAPE